MFKYKIPIYNQADNSEKNIFVNNNFKELLKELNENFILPSKFTMCYSFTNNGRMIYLACPSDFKLFLKRVDEAPFKIVPLLQIVPLRQDQFISKEQLQEAENLQNNLSEIYSQHNPHSNSDITEQQQQNYSDLQISRQASEKNEEENEFNKCQLCYQQLKLPYFRCLTCFFFQICQQCNNNFREQHHVALHTFTQLGNNHEKWEEVKTKAVSKIVTQQNKLNFKIHKGNIHEFIACDICNRNPIINIRYQCIDCQDYDLCQKCYQKSDHNPNHSLNQLTTNIEYIKL